MASIRSLIKKNVDRARHWLPYVSEKTRELVLITPALFCLGKDKAGIFSHPTCTPQQHALLRKHLGRNPGLAISRLPDYVLIESLIAVPRPSVVNDDLLGLGLVVIPSPGASPDTLRRKGAEVESFFRQRGMGVSVDIFPSALPPLVLMEVLQLGIVLAGRHPLSRPDDDTDMGIIVGEVPGTITDARSLTPSEWNPFQHVLKREVDRLVVEQGYHPHLHMRTVNPFFLPYLPVLVRYEEDLDADMLLLLRLSMGALFLRFGPTREVVAQMMKAWGLSERQVPDVTSMDLTEAVNTRKRYAPLQDDELPIFSWPPKPSYLMDRVTLDWDGSGWSLKEADLFSHRHAWVILAWAAIAGILGRETTLKAPEGIMLKPETPEILAGMMDDIMMGTDIIVPSDARQGSLRIKDGRFFFSATPYAILEPGRKTTLSLFREVKKKAMLDDKGINAHAAPGDDPE